MSDELIFATPQWLYVIVLLVPLVVIKVISSTAAREGLAKITSSRLRNHLVTDRRPMGDWGRFILQLLGIALIAVALARPQKGFIEEMTRVEGRNIIIAIDTSRSMLAEDISPNSRTSRLTQAKLAAIDLIEQLPEDRIGLIAFAGSAFMQAPMTPDHAAVIETVKQLNTFVIERGGTNLTAAIDLARERFGKTDAARNALIMFTDGDDLEGVALKAAEKAKKDNVVIVTIGVGSETPTIVPDPESRQSNTFLKDKKGELVKTGMDAESLEKIAKATTGTFINLKGGLMNNQLVSEVLENISYSQSEEKLKRTPREWFAIPLLAGLACIAAGYVGTLWGSRPAAQRALTALFFISFMMTASLSANPFSDAYDAFEGGNYTDAKERYARAAEGVSDPAILHELSFGRGASAYHNGDYNEAVVAFGSSLTSDNPALQERAHYNLGNTLFRKGEKLWKDEEKGGAQAIGNVIREFEDASKHYQSTLRLNNQNDDAKTNLEIVEDLLEQLRQIQQQQQQQQQEQEEQQKNEEEQQQEEEDQQEKQEQQDKKEEEQENRESQEEEDAENPKESDNEEEQEEQSSGEGDEEEPPQEQGNESGDESENPQDGSPGEEGEQDGEQSGQPQEPDGREGEQGEVPEDVPEPDPDDQVDEDTGYSKNQARENLRELSDEQGDLGLLRRRRFRQRPRSYKDW